MSAQIAQVSKQDLVGLFSTIQNQSLPVSTRAGALDQAVDGYSNEITSLLPKHVDFHRMKQLFILSVKQAPKLLDCDPGSLMKSLFTAASMGLEPDPYFGQVYLLPYGKNVQVIPGYKGLLKLVRNSGEITSITAEAVKENDEFEYDLASGTRPKHRPVLKNRGETIAFYCIANFRDGGFHFELMTREDVDRIRDRSAAAKAGKSTPWATDYDEMGKKTVIRRAVKRLPISLTREVRVAIASDDAAFQGRTIDIDQSTGEVMNIWAEDELGSDILDVPAVPAENPTSRLDAFAGAPVNEQEASQP